jgi:hypothetical protein
MTEPTPLSPQDSAASPAEARASAVARFKVWLAAPVTLTLPGWGVLALAVAGLALIGVALD